MLPVAGLIEPGPLARGAGRIINRAQDAVVAVDEGENFPLILPMIAGGEAVDTAGEHLVGNGTGQPEASGGVFGVGNDEIGFQPSDQTGHMRRHRLAARPADNVADEKNIHDFFISPDRKMTSCRVG